MKYIVYAEGLIAVPHFVNELSPKLIERCRTGEVILFSTEGYKYCKYGVWNDIESLTVEEKK